jgi:NADH-quinone oxidoreductase subunit G
MQATANVAIALQKKNPNTKISFTLPESNSMGLAMMGGHRLNSAFDAVLNGHADTVIVMENDLYRHGRTDLVDEFLKECKRVVLFDHAHHATAKKSHVIIPAGTFAESDGTLVNNEGRAQRFFQIYESTEVIQESWRWLLSIGARAGNDRIAKWRNFEDITHAIAQQEPLLSKVDLTAPPPDFRIAGQKIARQPHRYSGRTAMNAGINVSEPKPPEDPDSPLSYTMEGYRGMPPSSMIPYFWAPGWNSVQSVNKYQEEVGGPLRGGDPGVRLLEPATTPKGKYFTDIPESFKPMKDHLWVVPLYHIFGSEELSTRSEAVSTRIQPVYVLINSLDAAALGITDGQSLSFEIEGEAYRLPVKTSVSLKPGLAGVPYGMSGLRFSELPAWANIRLSEVGADLKFNTSHNENMKINSNHGRDCN